MQPAVGVIGEGLVELGCDEADLLGVLRCGFGGDVANTAVMAARVGASARVCARVGSDALGQRLLSFWRQTGVDVSSVRLDPHAPTGIYVNLRTPDGTHRFDYHRAGSAGSRLDPSDVTETFLDGLAFLHYSGVSMSISAHAARAASAAAHAARSRGASVSFAVNHRPSLRPATHALAHEAREADVVFASLEEARDVFGSDDEPALVERLGVRELIITNGHAGASVYWQGLTCRIAAPRVPVVDAAGAGDALAGAYLAARISGAEPPAALRQGVAAASLSCARFGCARSYPDAADVVATAATLA